MTASAGAGVRASYAIGAVTGANCPHRAGLTNGGVEVTAGYWNSDTSPAPNAANNGGVGKTTAELQSPTAYGTGANDIYKDWNVDVDGDGTADDPWDFGANNQYPALKYGGFVLAVQGRPTDYDDDNDGLIDIRSLAQLDAVRYDLDGQGDQDSVSAANWAKYQKAFPNPIAGMGCRLTDHDDDSATAEQPTCRGYELRRDLDFDTDGDGQTHTDGTGDAGDDYYNSGLGWDPIGGSATYTAEFHGRGYVIANLYVSRGMNYTGLFGQLGSTGKIIGVGLTNPRVQNGWSTVGALVGQSDGLVAASYARGGSVAGSINVGGLVGGNGAGGATAGRIVASYATTAVACASGNAGARAGGLTSRPGAGIAASYATGAVTGNCPLRAGLTNGSAAVSSSYWQTRSPDLTGSDPGGATRSAALLQGPACYTGDYAEWNVDVDGDWVADQPWYFGGNTDYPALQYGGHQVTKQGITTRLAELSGLDIAPGQIYNDFVHCPMEYQAAAGPAVTQLTVSPTAPGVTLAYQDGNDATLADADGDTAGWQTPLAAGENTVQVSVGAGRNYVLKVHRAVADPGFTAAAATERPAGTTWATRNGRLETTQLSGSTRDAQPLIFAVDLSGGQPPAAAFWTTKQVWLCTTRAVNTARPTAAAGCVNAGVMGNTDALTASQAKVDATVTAAQAANGGVVVKVWDTTSSALQLAQWLPIRLADDAALRGLEIAAGGLLLPPFAPSRHSYTYYPPAGAAAITATATANNPGATVAYSGTDADGNADGHQLPVGSAAGAVSAFNVTVTAADGTTPRQYAVTIGTGVAPGLVIAPSPLVVRDGGNGSYTVALNQAPSAAVTVSISRQARTGGGVAEAEIRVGSVGNWGDAATLEFTTENWNTPQTVSVQTPAPADADTNDEADTFAHRVAVAAANAAEYRGVTADLTVDIKEPGIILSATDDLKVDEAASAAVAYTVKLKAPPSAAVTVTVDRDANLDEVQFSATAAGTYANSLELTFTTENWNTAQTVYVKAGEDSDTTNDTGTITHTAGATGGYTASTTATRTVTVDDNDDPGLVINPSPLNMEEGRNATYTVKLATAPAPGANVTVTIARQATGASNAVEFNTDNGNDYYTGNQTLTFTANNWETPQTVYVRAAADSDTDNERDVLTHDMTGSSDTVYSGLADDELTVNVTDTVSAGLSVSRNTLSIAPGATGNYTVRLTAPPAAAANVVVTPAASADSGLTLTATPPLPLTFTTQNWDRAQTVEVMAAAEATTGATATVTHTLSSSGDANYNVQTFSAGNVTVNIAAAAPPTTGGGGGGGFGGGGGGFGGGGFGGSGGGAAASAAPPPDIEFSVESIAMDEGMAAAYRVRLSAAPVGAATVTIASSSSGVTATPDTLDFADAWNQWQTVLITAARDRNSRDATARLTHRGPEGSRGVLEVSIADTWPEAVTRTVNGHTLTITYTQDAPYGVTAEAPETLAADATVTVSAAPGDTPPTPLAYGLGEGTAAPAHISVSGTGTGTDGLTICLPAVAAATAAAASVAEGDDPPPPTLLRYAGTAADGSWQPVENAEVVADSDTGLTTVCAAGITGEAVFAAAYPLPPLGMMSDFTATSGDDPGTVTLTWTPGANANLHFIAGVSRADLDAGRYVFAIWNWSDEPDSHTYTDLDSGVLYYITAIAGRYFPARDQAQWSAWVNWQLATPN